MLEHEFMFQNNLKLNFCPCQLFSWPKHPFHIAERLARKINQEPKLKEKVLGDDGMLRTVELGLSQFSPE